MSGIPNLIFLGTNLMDGAFVPTRPMEAAGHARESIAGRAKPKLGSRTAKFPDVTDVSYIM